MPPLRIVTLVHGAGTSRAGVYVAGAAIGPETIDDSIAQAQAPIPQGTQLVLPPRQVQGPPQTVQQVAAASDMTPQQFMDANPQFKSATEMEQTR